MSPRLLPLVSHRIGSVGETAHCWEMDRWGQCVGGEKWTRAPTAMRWQVCDRRPGRTNSPT